MDTHKTKRIAWKIVFGLLLFFIGARISADGLRAKWPPLGVPLIGAFEDTDLDIDLALLASLGVVFAAAHFWAAILRTVLLPQINHVEKEGWNKENHDTLLWIIGVGLVLLDGIVFYLGAAEHSAGLWDKKGFSGSGLVLSCLYVFGVLAGAYFTVKIECVAKEEGR